MSVLAYRRIRAGYYSSSTTTTLDGEQRIVTIHIDQVDSGGWMIEVTGPESESLVRVGDCQAPTLGGAKSAVLELVSRGFAWYDGLGWCAASTK